MSAIPRRALIGLALSAAAAASVFGYRALRSDDSPRQTAPRVATSAAPPPPKPFAPPVTKRTPTGDSLFLPASCDEGSYDAVIHFHGAEPVMLAAVTEAELRAVVLVKTHGTSSDGYRDSTRPEGSLSRILSDLGSKLSEHCGGPRALRRVALSSWSAGFAAVQQLLRDEADRARVDAVLLADSMHAGFIDPTQRKLADTQLAPFVEFARAAARGEKLMLMTHTSIQTEGYASTTETADHLLVALGIARTPDPEGGGAASSAHRGGFFLRGRAGTNEKAHADELRSYGRVFFPVLRDHWRGVRSTPLELPR